MIRPKVHQAFGERPCSQRGALRARQHLCAVMGLIGLANGVECGHRIRVFRCRGLLHFLALVAGRQEIGIDLIGWRQGRTHRQRCRSLDLRQEPPTRFSRGGGQITRFGAQSEP